MPEVAKKKRIFQIANELNISHIEIMEFLSKNDISVLVGISWGLGLVYGFSQTFSCV